MILSELVTYIATQLSLIEDTTIFNGVVHIDAIEESHILIRMIAGGTDSISGMKKIPIQVLSYAKSYLAAENLAVSVHDLIGNKAGFVGITDITYCAVIGRPALITQDARGFYIFSATYLVSIS